MNRNDVQPRRTYRSGKTSLSWGGILLLVALCYLAWPMLGEFAKNQLPSPALPADAVADSPGSDSYEDASTEKASTERRLGQLTEVGGRVMVSTAGLRYTPGSQEGHRLQHVLRHDNDQPSRPGLHGVFDGDADQLLAVIDEAYLLVKRRSPQVQSRREQGRMVYDVDMKRRIGFIGGQEGRRKGNPPATHVRLVLEDDRVITAFPY